MEWHFQERSLSLSPSLFHMHTHTQRESGAACWARIQITPLETTRLPSLSGEHWFGSIQILRQLVCDHLAPKPDREAGRAAGASVGRGLATLVPCFDFSMCGLQMFADPRKEFSTEARSTAESDNGAATRNAAQAVRPVSQEPLWYITVGKAEMKMIK